jgi:hypothetical protein
MIRLLVAFDAITNLQWNRTLTASFERSFAIQMK